MPAQQRLNSTRYQRYTTAAVHCAAKCRAINISQPRVRQINSMNFLKCTMQGCRTGVQLASTATDSSSSSNIVNEPYSCPHGPRWHRRQKRTTNKTALQTATFCTFIQSINSIPVLPGKCIWRICMQFMSQWPKRGRKRENKPHGHTQHFLEWAPLLRGFGFY